VFCSDCVITSALQVQLLFIIFNGLQGVGLRFEAEATGWLQNQAIPLTDDTPKYGSADVAAKVLAILTPGSTFVESTAAAAEAANGSGEGVPVGLVLDTTSFYAESGGQVSHVGVCYVLFELVLTGFC
jgi:alanyl-tRNA synthetase